MIPDPHIAPIGIESPHSSYANEELQRIDSGEDDLMTSEKCDTSPAMTVADSAVVPPSEAALCRVCHCEGDDAQPLFHPCKCSGSIRFIHQDCLTSWLEFSKKSNCELCGEAFGFRNVYAPDMPHKIGWAELVSEIYPNVIEVLNSLSVVVCHFVFVWGVIPYATFLEIQCCVCYLLGETLKKHWYLCESFSDFILMWFLGLSVTFLICFLSLNVMYFAQFLRPAPVEAPLAVDNHPVHPIVTAERPVADAAPGDRVSPDAPVDRDDAALPAIDGARNAGLELDTSRNALYLISSLDEADIPSPPPISSPPFRFSPTASGLTVGFTASTDRENDWERMNTTPWDGSLSDSFADSSTHGPSPDRAATMMSASADEHCIVPGSGPVELSVAAVNLLNANSGSEGGDELDDMRDFHGIERNEVTDSVTAEEIDEAVRPVGHSEAVAAAAPPEDVSSDEEEEDVIGMLLQPPPPRGNGNNAGGGAAPPQEILIDIDLGHILDFFSTIPDSLNIFRLKNPTNIIEWIVATLVVVLTQGVLIGLLVIVPTTGGAWLYHTFASNPYFRYVVPMESVVGVDNPLLRDFVTKTLQDLQKGQKNGSLFFESPSGDIGHAVDMVLKSVEMVRFWLLGCTAALSVVAVVGIVGGIILCSTGLVAVPAHPFTRRNVRRLRRPFRQFKLVSRMLTEILCDVIIVPHLVGWLIDFVTLETMNVTYSQRLKYCAAHPVTTGFIHTVVGFLFISHLRSVLTVLRDILKEHVADSLYLNTRYISLISEYPEVELAAAARRSWGDVTLRVGVSFAYIVPAVFVMIFLPARYGHYVVFSMDPILIHVEEIDYYVQIPLELIIFHVLIPFLCERMHYRSMIYNAVSLFLQTCCEPLGLSGIILKPSPVFTVVADDDVPPHVHVPMAEDMVEGVELLPGVVISEETHLESMENEIMNLHDRDIGAPEITSDNSNTLPSALVDNDTTVGTSSNINNIEDAHESEIDPQMDSTESAENIGLLEGRSPSLSDDHISNVEGYAVDNTAAQYRSKAGRIVLLIMMSLIVVSFTSSLALYVPLLVGRTLMNRISVVMHHDLYNICAGYAFLWSLDAGVRYLIADIGSHRSFFVMLELMQRYAVIVAKVLLLGATWTGVVPMLVGMYCELVFFVPVQGAYNESARISMLQCWAIGFVFTKIWIRCVTMGFLGENSTWKRRFDRVLIAGLQRTPFSFIFEELMLPIMKILLDLLLLPYFISVSVLKIGVMTNIDISFVVQNLLVRYSYSIFFLVRSVSFVSSAATDYLQKKLNDIRDAKYLLSRELTNR